MADTTDRWCEGVQAGIQVLYMTGSMEGGRPATIADARLVAALLNWPTDKVEQFGREEDGMAGQFLMAIPGGLEGRSLSISIASFNEDGDEARIDIVWP